MLVYKNTGWLDNPLTAVLAYCRMIAEVTKMTDKKTFGLFIKAKRTEKNYSQKIMQMLEMLYYLTGLEVQQLQINKRHIDTYEL